MFPDFFRIGTLLIVRTWNSTSFRSTYCTVPTTSGRPHGSPLVWACQWLSWQPLSSLQLSHNDWHWAKGIIKVTARKVWTIGRVRNCLDGHLGQIVCNKDGVVDWCIVLVEMPLTRFEKRWPLPTESLPELP